MKNRALNVYGWEWEITSELLVINYARLIRQLVDEPVFKLVSRKYSGGKW